MADTKIHLGDDVWAALPQHGWQEGEQQLTRNATSITSCASPYTRGGQTLVLVAVSPYDVRSATLDGVALPDRDAVWQAITSAPTTASQETTA